ncbi:hypothetical protein Nepgr_006936 [Nepenthes gracilis]|uniref:Uncharacterized protein n=1 Tax=Nepenthes gracilis TaxID=150966 RepID=A0AAD3S674_NEPGR|nr:hypothetical protein Nepgr_006936 [Nepenthes gracilis]
MIVLWACDAQCCALSTKGSMLSIHMRNPMIALRFAWISFVLRRLYEVVNAILLLENYAGERWNAVVRLAWWWMAESGLVFCTLACPWPLVRCVFDYIFIRIGGFVKLGLGF